MIPSVYSSSSKVIFGPVASIEEADLVFLTVTHGDRSCFEKVRNVLKTYSTETGHLLLLEQPNGRKHEQLLEVEVEKKELQREIFGNYELAGWDHENSEIWANEFRNSTDSRKFQNALTVLKTLDKSTDQQSVINAFSTLAEALRHVENDKTLLPNKEYIELIKEKKYQTEEFKKLSLLLQYAGKRLLDQRKEVFMKKTYPPRQRTLERIIASKALLKKISHKKTFVVLGESHCRSNSPFCQKESEKLINFIEKLFKYIIL